MIVDISMRVRVEEWTNIKSGDLFGGMGGVIQNLDGEIVHANVNIAKDPRE